MMKLDSRLYSIFLLIITPAIVSLNLLRLPTCFLIGDSISVQYAPYLEKYLDGIVVLDRKDGDAEAYKNLDIPRGASGGDSKMVLDFLKVQLKDPSFQPDYFVFNFGLHDIKHNLPKGEIQIGLEDYKDNLTTVIRLLKERNIKPIWIRTTPVIDSVHNSRQPAFKRYAKDLKLYNQTADEICKTAQIPVIDLNTFTAKQIPEHYIDHVHFDETTRALQAAYLSGAIQQIILTY